MDLELSLLFVHPPAISDAEKEAAVRDYVERYRHCQQVWDSVGLYDTALQGRQPLRAPTLIIWGRDDSIFDIGGADMLRRRIRGATLATRPQAGHLLLIENAAAAGATYTRFLRHTGR